jgi:hypothetical protein
MVLQSRVSRGGSKKLGHAGEIVSPGVPLGHRGPQSTKPVKGESPARVAVLPYAAFVAATIIRARPFSDVFSQLHPTVTSTGCGIDSVVQLS